ncbi:MAG: Wzz/FepE/Etk N-terminal domain-containing protein [Eubacteriales bacterium]
MEKTGNDQVIDQQEISLIGIIKKLWDKKWIIAIVTVSCILLGSIYTFVLLKDTYQSESTILAEADEEVLGFTLEDYKQQLKSQELIDTIIKSLGMSMSPDELNEKIDVSSTDANIQVVVRLSDPETSISVTNALVENFIPYMTEIAQEKSESEIEAISVKAEAAKSKLLNQSDALNDYITKHPSSSYLDLEIETLKSRAAQYQTELVDTDKDILVYKSMLAALYDRADDIGLNIKNKISLEDDTIDATYPAYSKLDSASLRKEITNTETALSKANAEKEAIAVAIEDTQNLINEKQSEQASAEYEYNYLDNNYHTALNSYLTYQQRLMDLRDRASSDYGETHFTIISKAVTSTAIKPNHVKNLAVALLIGLLLGAAIVYIRDYFQKFFKKKQ